MALRLRELATKWEQVPPSARTPVCVFILLSLNVYISLRLFQVEYLQFMGSIEAAYIGLARYIVENPTALTWFPLWYTGIPFENTYPPLMHLTTAGAAWLADISPARAHHVVGATAYCMGPVTLFALAYRLSGSRGSALACGVFYSLVSPSAILMPASVGEDLAALLGPRRFQTLPVYGEGPHILSLALLPLALLLLDRALDRPRPPAVAAAAIAVAAVPLANWLGAFALAVGACCLLLARDDVACLRTWLWAALIGAAAYAIASPWLPPGNIRDIRRNAQFTVGAYPMGLEQALFAIILAAAVGSVWFALRRAQVPKATRFAALFTLAIGAVPLGAEWTGRYVVPQPERYHLEMEQGVALLFGLGAAVAWRRSAVSARLVLVAIGLAACVYQTLVYRHQAHDMTAPLDITGTVEYQAADWIGTNLPGRRIFATGSIQFWLNAFADNPQIGGGFAQGIVNPTIPMVQFGIPFTAGDGERTAMWLRAYGVDAIVASGPATRDSFPGDFRDAAKFEGVLPELWRSGDDVIYDVPRRARSLAHVIRHDQVVSRTPSNIEDVAPITAYVAALEDESLPIADFAQESSNRFRINAVLSEEHLISVQQSYRTGWRASVWGEPVAIRPDGLGFLVLDAPCKGPCEVELVYDGGVEALVTGAAGLGAPVGLGLWWLWDRRKIYRNRVQPD